MKQSIRSFGTSAAQQPAVAAVATPLERMIPFHPRISDRALKFFAVVLFHPRALVGYEFGYGRLSIGL